MLTGLFTSANALSSFQTSMDNTSNNLANINTTAFKKSTVSFQDLMYTGSLNQQVGNGVKVAAVGTRGFGQGTITKTGRDTDIAINGKGFLIVQIPDGTFQYTRDGSLSRDANGRLVTNAGYIVQPPITIPADTLSTSIALDGTVTVMTSSAPNVPKVIGQIQLAGFTNQEGLKIEAGNLYSETAASGPPLIATPGTSALGQLQQSNLEQSNVNLSSELTTMVTTQQAYAANSKVINTTTQMISSALALIT